MNLESKTQTTFAVGLKTFNNNEIHPQEVIDAIAEYVDAGTFYESKGLWEGSTENSIVFECVDIENKLTGDAMDEIEESDAGPVEYLKDVLETRFKQDSVMVKQSQIEVAF